MFPTERNESNFKGNIYRQAEETEGKDPPSIIMSKDSRNNGEKVHITVGNSKNGRHMRSLDQFLQYLDPGMY